MKNTTIRRREFLGASLGLSVAGAAAALAAGSASGAAEKPAATGGWEDNEVIQESRQVALDILKPSQKDLEHGLELHANSVVFDSYGFAPRAAVDGDAIRQAAEAGASAIELKDMREDMSMTRYAIDPAERAEFVQAWEASGVTCIFQNAGEEGQDPMRLIKRLARFTYATDMMRDFMPKAVTPDDIEAAANEKRHCLYFTGNGAPLRQHWVSVEDELRYVRIFFQLGIRMMHLTYQRRNMIGDGCGETSDAGLSDFGRAAVAEMNRVGMIVDVAHSGWQTSLDGAKASQKPMVASHSTCAALYKHIRSKPDEVIRAIVDTGGLVGICCVPAYLGGTGDIAALLDHIDYVAKKFGIGHVAIGTDVAYASRNSATENKKIPPRSPQRKEFRSLWPDDAFTLSPDVHPKARQSLAWTNWPLFTVGLVQRGYSDQDIQKILAGNMLRVARTALA
ncbi:MAG: membrane dipeptidase [Planctomycetes bacterium]|nr:membrane dipeptidase [Planctomycetota bacterium]MBL7043748.1 membrane dipeptidase [Pirellulaceae bacterium]